MVWLQVWVDPGAQRIALRFSLSPLCFSLYHLSHCQQSSFLWERQGEHGTDHSRLTLASLESPEEKERHLMSVHSILINPRKGLWWARLGLLFIHLGPITTSWVIESYYRLHTPSVLDTVNFSPPESRGMGDEERTVNHRRVCTANKNNICLLDPPTPVPNLSEKGAGCHSWDTSCVPDTVTNTFHVLGHLILNMILWSMFHYLI